MKTVQINMGLDFGTHQTKVCIQIEEGQGKRFEFVPLNPTQKGIDATLLPSLIHILPGNRFNIGEAPEEAIKSYGFFKIASAEDEEFHTDLQINADKYDKSAFAPYYPEQLAVIYVAGVILLVREHVRKTILQSPSSASRSSFFGQAIAANASEKKAVWRYRMGVPTEYHSPRNAKRKRKFEQILVLALAIAEQFEQDYEHANLTELLQAIEDQHRQLMRTIRFDETQSIDPEIWKSYLSDRFVSIFPETAAGLIFLVRTGKLSANKHYLAMDIGGGSTDISFFKAEDGDKFTYLASKSVMYAANDVAMGMGIHSDLLHVRDTFSRLFNTPGIESDTVYQIAFHCLGKKMNDSAYHMFNSQVYYRFLKTKAVESYKDSTCYLYGGGSALPTCNLNPEQYLQRVFLHGPKNSFISSSLLYSKVEPIESLTIEREHAHIVTLGWETKIRVLVVCLGLSLSMPDDEFMIAHIEEDFMTEGVDSTTFSNMFDFPTAQWLRR